MQAFEREHDFVKPILSFISNILIKSADVKELADKFGEIDQNHDGSIDREEFKDVLSREFCKGKLNDAMGRME